MLDKLKGLWQKRKTIIIIVLVAIIITAISYILPNNNSGQPASSPAPKAGSTSNQASSKISISGIEVNNFLKNPLRTDNRKDATFLDNPKYGFVYFQKENQFLISITGSPFSTVKIQAENEFLTKLGIDKDQACRLNVVITTPYYANPNESGKNYKLSFCN